jgi:hypothetical protein
MDRWTTREIALMKASGGNAAVRSFLEQHGVGNFDTLTARQKYDTPQGELLRRVLQARVDGIDESTITLPSTTSTTSTTLTSTSTTKSTTISSSEMKKRIQGLGSSSPPTSSKNASGSSSSDQDALLRRCVYVTVTAVVVVIVATTWMGLPH